MRKSEIVLFLALTTSLATSFWLWHELRASRAQLAELQNSPPPATITSLDTRDEGIRAVVMPVEAPGAAEPPPAAAASASGPAKATSPGPPQDDWQVAQRRLLQDPRYREAYREQARNNLGLRRENLIRVAGLSPAQADAVIELQIDRELGWIVDPETLNQHYAASEREHQARLRELLGQEKHLRMQQYMESRASRMQVDQLRNLLGGADTLRDDQVEPLIAALHVENTQLRDSLREHERTFMWSSDPVVRSGYLESRVELEKAAHARMRDAAAPYLSGTQLEKFDSMLARDLERRSAEQRMESLQAKIGSKPPDND